jgi:hypothetical protein
MVKSLVTISGRKKSSPSLENVGITARLHLDLFNDSYLTILIT